MSVTFSAPKLETERLILRAPDLSDFDALADFYTSPRAAFVGGPQSRELSWRALAQEAGHWVLRAFGRWTLIEKDTQAPVGIVGLWHPEGFPERELGWDLFNGATGKGYATEAARAARDYAYNTLGWTTLTSLIAVENHNSARVAERLGATYDSDFTHERYGPMQLWRHLGPEALT
ncbi:GNAT family N-acetyltransferase [Tateyamaria omphalii]|uniref:GNAT family N-acetyltransferase n=1 Tax=Tateyamaria omphalii TaxID=299262 RepID=UPI001C99F441|nr:GNAT family N-acetyltransferase [Tateyamaria omphalii]MBY5934563.1 GNAT family N-acetyltransferase [Tateyamaria omphalii]